jgi:UV DNA damage repair endonuclease
MTKKIGFACKWIDHAGQVDGIKPKDDAKKYQTAGTTVAWLNRQTKDVAEQKLWDIMEQNLASAKLLVERVGQLEENLRMVRLGSDMLPVYTEPTWSYFWRRPDVMDRCSRGFSDIGNTARRLGVRLSFHPGQFTVLASESDDIVNRSIEEFEYHADMARWMGYGRTFQDLKINVHISGRRGPEGIKAVIPRLSPEARNCLTIENDEISWGIDSSIELVDHCALVLDIHHHWIHTGEYINANDDRVKRIIDSWRGVRPVIHYSVSREDLLTGHSGSQRPALLPLMESGHKKGKLRAHSDFYWNTAVNEWALSFLDQFDIMAESKGKNLASFALHKQARELNLL